MKALLPIVMLVIVGAPAISGEIPAREKMLIRFILQREFSTELGHQLERRKDLMEELRSGAFAEMLAGISRTDDATMRTVMVLYLGMPWREHLSEVREKIKRALKAEPDKWVKLEMARVLACLGDDAGKEVLVSALGEEGGYMTSSGIEVGKAVLPLLLLNYDFPGGFPKTARNYEGLGGLHEYFDAIRRQEVKAIR